MRISVDTITFDVEGDDWRTQVTVDRLGVVTRIAPRFQSLPDDGYAREQMIEAELIRDTREADFMNWPLVEAAAAAIRYANAQIPKDMR